jgi:hypothetical protein
MRRRRTARIRHWHYNRSGYYSEFNI